MGITCEHRAPSSLPSAAGPRRRSRWRKGVLTLFLRGQDNTYFKLCRPRSKIEGVTYVLLRNYLKYIHFVGEKQFFAQGLYQNGQQADLAEAVICCSLLGAITETQEGTGWACDLRGTACPPPIVTGLPLGSSDLLLR